MKDSWGAALCFYTAHTEVPVLPESSKLSLRCTEARGPAHVSVASSHFVSQSSLSLSSDELWILAQQVQLLWWHESGNRTILLDLLLISKTPTLKEM